MTRTLVDQALELAAKYEQEGNKEMAEHWLKRAEELDKVYDKYEKQKGIIKE